MVTRLEKVEYSSLNPPQRENYNCQKVAAVLADYRFICMRMSEDWRGADVLACHVDGKTLFRVQLKGRAVSYKKYQGKDLWICFSENGGWYLNPHNEVLKSAVSRIQNLVSWDERRGYSFPTLPQWLETLLSPYRIQE